MKKRSSSDSKGVSPPPSGFDEEQEFAWKNWSQWRLTFLSKRSQIKRTLLIDWVKVNLPAIFIATMLGLLFHLKTPISITGNPLSTLVIGILAASAAILTIIVAFLTFWFSGANNSMQRTRAMIKDEVRNLEAIKRDIDPLTAGPKEGLAGTLKDNLEKLAEKSESFLTTLKTLGGRFSRAAPGTYYDSGDLTKLDIAIRETGGEWFKAYSKVFKGHSEHDFCIKTWENAMETSRRISDLNDEVQRSSNQIMQIIYFMPTLTSVLFIFMLSLVVAFMSSTGNLQPLAGLTFSLILVILLTIHLGRTVGFLWNLVSLKYVSYETNRLLDIQYSNKIEQQYPVDYTGALKKHAEIIVKTYAKRRETTNSKQ